MIHGKCLCLRWNLGVWQLAAFALQKGFISIFNKCLLPVECWEIHQRGCTELSSINNQYWLHLARYLQNLFLILSCLHIELILCIIWSLKAQFFPNKMTVNLKIPPFECNFIIKLRSHHLSFHPIFKWVRLNCELALSTPTMCRLLQNFLFGSLRVRKVKQGGNKYSTHFKLFQINFFGELNQCHFQLYLWGVSSWNSWSIFPPPTRGKKNNCRLLQNPLAEWWEMNPT